MGISRFFILLYAISKLETKAASEIATSKNETKLRPDIALMRAISKIESKLVSEIVTYKSKMQLSFDIAVSKIVTQLALRMLILKVKYNNPARLLLLVEAKQNRDRKVFDPVVV